MSTIKFAPQSITETIELKGYPGSEISIRTKLGMGEKRVTIAKYESKEMQESVISATAMYSDILAIAIVKWNFTMEELQADKTIKDVPLPITSKIIDQFTDKEMETMLKVAGIDLSKKTKKELEAEKKRLIVIEQTLDCLVEGRTVTSPHKNKAHIRAYNDYRLCKEFGWTEADIYNTSEEFYNNSLMIIAKVNAHKQHLQEAANRNNK